MNYNQSLDLDTLSCVNTYIDCRVVIRFLWNLARHIGIDTVVQMLKVSIELEEINQQLAQVYFADLLWYLL